ncbi:hypothetical protein RPMA_04120 [Tardiphaga alba]|uniref:DUF4142 domain-containing protein n=1 Tax=Tardiphaga alba TaxID=340268 RepID=A0ABX8A3S7_9BRAD|nr:hypothetical protein [Tardiphaga alba]QUS38127.1 hypothetical protein RPMA_04120 [Tardiphaga alba]
MKSFARFFAMSALAVSSFVICPGGIVLAQPAKQQATAGKQIALTEKQIESLLAAHKDIDSFTAKVAPSSSIAQANASVVTQLNDVVKKHGFADYADYSIVQDNIGLVMAGIDPKTKSYVGPEAYFKQKIAAVQADKTMSAEDKKEALDDLQASMKSPLPPIEHKGNIALVIRHFDKLLPLLKDE